jgi:hypothetical protein
MEYKDLILRSFMTFASHILDDSTTLEQKINIDYTNNEELAKNLELEVHISTDNRCKKYLTNDINIKSHIVDLYINLRGIINKLNLYMNQIVS